MACAAERRVHDQVDHVEAADGRHTSEAGGPLSLKELVKALAEVVRNKKSAPLQNATEAQNLLRFVDTRGVARLQFTGVVVSGDTMLQKGNGSDSH